jgi:single-strand DNA-binding protein
MYRNLVLLAGNLGADAEFVVLDHGVTLAKFRVATTKKWRDQEGGLKEATEWHPITLRLTTANQVSFFTEKLTKGAAVDIEGELRHRTYDKSDGTKGYATEVYADRVQVLSTSGAASKAAATPAAPASPAQPPTPSANAQPNDVTW